MYRYSGGGDSGCGRIGGVMVVVVVGVGVVVVAEVEVEVGYEA